MWAFSYLVVAFLAPGIGGSPVWLSALLFLVFGIALLLATILTNWTVGKRRTVGRKNDKTPPPKIVGLYNLGDITGISKFEEFRQACKNLGKRKADLDD